MVLSTAVFGFVIAACASEHADEVATSDSHETAAPSCETTPTVTDCISCCAAANPAGAAAYHAAINACVCQPDACASWGCSDTLCQGEAPNATCTACVLAQITTACADVVETSCTNDPNCNAYSACIKTASCSTKPSQ